MSFSFEFVAKNKYDAVSATGKAHAPGSVKAFVEAAIAGMKVTDATYIHVKANGHLCEDGNSYEVSTAQIEVKPIRPTVTSP